jgi:hypothetical protein
MFAALLVGLIVIYAGLLTLAVASRATDPRVRRALRYVGLAPLAAVVLARVIGVGATLVLLVLGVGAVMVWAGAPRGESEESPFEPMLERARRMGEAVRDLLYAEPVYANGRLNAVRADVLGALLGFTLAVAIVLLII